MPKQAALFEVGQFAFFNYLWTFYSKNRRSIRREYKDLTKKFLDFNDPDNGNSFLRQPQFEALEMYVFLKEGLDNLAVHELFARWRDSRDQFEGRDQLSLFEDLDKDAFDTIHRRLRKNARSYSNYIFALTMGTGKTILMATCIFYEFLLANKYPKDDHYCHNALVFAPDKTVLQSLREIQTFDMGNVVSPEYRDFLSTNIRFHFLDEAGMALSTLDRSRFNVIISNTQKIILKRQSKEKSFADKFFGSSAPTYQTGSIYSEFADLYESEQPDDEESLTTNQRFEKLRRLEQLGIYIDEAHHAFGADLARDMGAAAQTRTSLRTTVDELAASLKRSGTNVVACYNYTGTPYVGKEVLPEVVYAYGLQDAIDKAFLKRVRINGYTNPRTSEFVDAAIGDFLDRVGTQRYEGMLPKMAFFAGTIEELRDDLRPAVERSLVARSLSTASILVNVGDEKLTTNDEIREFNNLDSIRSEKQFILLVNKGREGWNCRSLFGVALYRRPRSRIFVLQATMRCLRAITDVQQTGNVYLSEENREILQDELEQNFRVSIDELQNAGADKETYEVMVVPPPVRIKLKRVQKLFAIREKPPVVGTELGLATVDRQKYRLLHTSQEGLVLSDALTSRRTVHDITALRERVRYSRVSLVGEVARYLNMSPLAVEQILDDTAEGMDAILNAVNEFNELLYDCVIPKLFDALFEIREYEHPEEHEVELVKLPPGGSYRIRAVPEKVVTQHGATALKAEYGDKSFHLDTYCFDSGSERSLFWALLGSKRVGKVYFTGMLTHGQSDFFIQYIDPDSHCVRSYYPDFLILRDDGTYVIVEVKADNQIETSIVAAKKEAARQLTAASGMTYEIVRSTDADAGRALAFLN